MGDTVEAIKVDGVLYSKYRARVFGVCLRMTGNYADAEDYMQEVFMALPKKIESYRGESAFGTWLHRVTVNHVLMGYRKHKNRNHFECPITKELATIAEKADSDLPNKRERLLQLQAAIKELPRGQRSTVELTLEGYTDKEISERLGNSRATVRTQLLKARARLREQLALARDAGTQAIR